MLNITSPFGPCLCSQLRRVTRTVSSVYDKALAPTGLTVTQHALLVNIARAGEIGRTSLAAQLGMERTTLTRNLRPLEKAKLVVPAESPDRRERKLCLSIEGRRKVRSSYKIWERTQQQLVANLGPQAVKQLRAALAAAENAATRTKVNT